MTEVRAGGRRYVGPPPPVDILLEPTRQLVPIKSGVTIRPSYELLLGPFGDFEVTSEYKDGVLVNVSFTVEDTPTVLIGVTFRNLVRLRRGEIEPFDTLGGGKIEGSQGRLALLAGIHEDPDCLAVERACAQERAGPALSALGELWAEPAFVTARRTLRARVGRAGGRSKRTGRRSGRTVNDLLLSTSCVLEQRVQAGEDLVGAQVSVWVGGD